MTTTLVQFERSITNVQKKCIYTFVHYAFIHLYIHIRTFVTSMLKIRYYTNSHKIVIDYIKIMLVIKAGCIR